MREANEAGPSHDALEGVVVTAASPVPPAGAGGAHSVTATREAEDPEEIDVSDQVETLEDGDAASDLDASEYLIIDDEGDEEDEDTSTNVAVWGTSGSSGVAPSVLVAPPAEAAPDAKPDAGSEPIEELVARKAAALVPETKQTPSAVTAPPKQTLVAAGTELKGRLASSYPVVVNGVMDGEIDTPTLSVSSTGVILGTVKARTLRSEGTLSANIEAGEVFVSGTVRSQTVIRTRRLEVKLGASDKGRLQITFGTCDFGSSDLRPEPEGTG